jgi:predicted kinase
MSHLLIVTGAPASGKSRLVGELKERLPLTCCAKDEIKETLFDRLGDQDGDALWSRRLSDASFALLFQFASRLLPSAGVLLLEGNFRAGEHEGQLHSLIECNAASVVQVLCVASAAVRGARLLERAQDHRRHPGHRDDRLAAGLAAGPDAAFLDLPGPRLRFDSEAPWEREFAHLVQELSNWCPPMAEL